MSERRATEEECSKAVFGWWKRKWKKIVVVVKLKLYWKWV